MLFWRRIERRWKILSVKIPPELKSQIAYAPEKLRASLAQSTELDAEVRNSDLGTDFDDARMGVGISAIAALIEPLSERNLRPWVIERLLTVVTPGARVHATKFTLYWGKERKRGRTYESIAGTYVCETLVSSASASRALAELAEPDCTRTSIGTAIVAAALSCLDKNRADLDPCLQLASELKA